MVKIIERIDHKYEDQETGEAFSLAWRHVKLEGSLLSKSQLIKELFMPPDSKVKLFPQKKPDGYNHYIVSGWWGRSN